MIGNKNIIIQARDLKLLRTTALLRFIDRQQATIIGGFSSVPRVNATMLRLLKAKLLQRFFLGVGVGTRKSIYSISKKGAALVGMPYRRLRRESNGLYSGDLFLEHQLLLNDIYLAIHRPELAALVQNWRTFDRPLPHSSVIPDAYFEIIRDQIIKPVFLEVDKATESKTIWKKKTAGYLSFALSGAFEKTFGHSQFRVAVITTQQQALKRIQSAISEQTSKVFWLTTFSAIKTAGFFSAIWQRPSGEDKYPFF